MSEFAMDTLESFKNQVTRIGGNSERVMSHGVLELHPVFDLDSNLIRLPAVELFGEGRPHSAEE
jgi:hypothetical protein